MSLPGIIAIRIGFQLPQYNFTEPKNSHILIDNVTLIKEGNRQSEQTFNISIRFGDPGTGIHTASSQHTTSDNNPDYVTPFDSVAVFQSFPPHEQVLVINITLLPDDLLEGLEGFRISATPVFPVYDNPVSSFTSTLIQIYDSDGKFYCSSLPSSEKLRF